MEYREQSTWGFLPPIVPTIHLICRCGRHHYHHTIYHHSCDPRDISAIYKRKSLSEILPGNDVELMTSLARLSQSEMTSRISGVIFLSDDLPLRKLLYPNPHRERLYRDVPRMQKLAVSTT